jgi:eukaryotic-like serine/threonine-protein kinase
VVLYEMLAGQRPFPGGSPSAVAEAILSGDPPSLSGVRPAAPPGLGRIVKTALGKTPAARYQSAQAFERDLLGLGLALDLPAGFTPSGGSTPGEAPPIAAPARPRWTVVAALVLAAGVMALAVWALAGAPVHLAAP